MESPQRIPPISMATNRSPAEKHSVSLNGGVASRGVCDIVSGAGHRARKRQGYCKFSFSFDRPPCKPRGFNSAWFRAGGYEKAHLPNWTHTGEWPWHCSHYRLARGKWPPRTPTKQPSGVFTKSIGIFPHFSQPALYLRRSDFH